jgi:predicted Zn-dependent peptidase
MMQNLKLSDEEFQTERKVVAEERRWRTDNSPTGLLYFTLFNSAFVYHPYHWTPIGFMDDILHWDIETIREFYKLYYQPNNAVLVVSGDISTNGLFDAAKLYFGNIKGFDSPKTFAIEPKQLGSKRVLIKKQSEVEIVALAWKIPNFEHPDMPSISALSHILGNGKSSRLYSKLVDELKLANSVSAYSMELKDPGLFLILAVCNVGVKAEAVESEIRSEITKIQKFGLKQSDIDKLKINVKADFIFSLESANHVSDLFGEYLARGNLAPLLEVENAIDALTPQKLQKIAKEYFIDETCTTLILIDDK